MRLFYNKDLTEDDSRLIIEREESRHIVRVLRKKVGDTIYVTNGKGILFTTKIDVINKNNTELKIITDSLLLLHKEFVRHGVYTPERQACFI